jgi:hypothetical protein
MKVRDEDGKEYNWNLSGLIPKESDERPRSKLHLKIRGFLKELYPQDIVTEEVPIPGKVVFLDFYLPLRKLAVEVNGEQHYKFNTFHFKNKRDFLEAQRRDRYKIMWCELNAIKLVSIRFDEEDESIRRQLTGG